MNEQWPLGPQFPSANLTTLCFLCLALCGSVILQGAADVSLAWDANKEPDIEGYNLYYGAVPRNYEEKLNVGNQTLVTLSSLEEGGTYYFAVTAYNRAGIESELSNEISFSVPRQNHPPAVFAQSVKMDEDTSAPVVLRGADPEGDPLTYWVVAGPAHGLLSGTPPNLVYRPSPNFAGADVFAFKANDGFLDSEEAAVTIEVLGFNDAPAADPQTVSVKKNGSIAITLTGADADGDTLTYYIVDLPQYGTLTGTPPGVVYTSKGNYNGLDRFVFKVNDGRADSAPASVWISVGRTYRPSNETPQSLDGAEAIEEIEMTFSRLGGDALIAFNGIPGFDYMIQVSSDLVHWQEWKAVVPDESGYGQVLVSGIEQNGMAFYRVTIAD